MVTGALNHQEIKHNPERNSTIEQFLNKSNCKGIIYSIKLNHWKRFEKKINNQF